MEGPGKWWSLEGCWPDFQISVQVAQWAVDRARDMWSTPPWGTSRFSLSKIVCTIYSNFRYKVGVEEDLKRSLNKRWHLQWSSKQWTYRFRCIWAFPVAQKHCTLLWLVLHKAVWTGKKALNLGIGNGICPRCHSRIEDITHLFIGCSKNSKYLQVLADCSPTILKLSYTHLLLGVNPKVDILLWGVWRSIFLWSIWCMRNDALFNNTDRSSVFSFIHSLKNSAHSCCNTIKEAPVDASQVHQIQKDLRWQRWKYALGSLYSSSRLSMRDRVIQM